MGDTPKWSGGKTGRYHLHKRYRNISSDAGRIYEAHNVETGAFALVVRPGRAAEVELHGGCWVPLEYKAPCPRSTAELNGKCYMPVRQKPPEPRSLQP